MKLIPRYVFRKGEMCPHGEPDCLCDVIVTEPVEIDTTVRHWFFENALAEIDDDLPTSRNIIELASVALGLHRMFMREVADTDEPGKETVMFRTDGTYGPAAWRALPIDVQHALRNHYTCDTPWKLARLELDGLHLTKPDMDAIYKFYAGCRYNAFQNEVEKSHRMALITSRECRHCGKMFKSQRDTTTFCGDICRKKAENIRKARRRAAARDNKES